MGSRLGIDGGNGGYFEVYVSPACKHFDEKEHDDLY